MYSDWRFKALEENEKDWFSLWCDIYTIDDLLVLINRNFEGDPLFNRVYIYKKEFQIEKIREFFNGIKAKGFLFLNYEVEGLRKVDELKTMVLEEFKGRVVDFKIVDKVNLEEWIKVYCSAFDIPFNWKEEIYRRLKVISEDPKSKLILAYKGERALGSMALYSTSKVLGIYCLGTLKEFRNMGVASSLLAYAFKEGKGKLVSLQTLASDNKEGFYLNRGFKTLYSKFIYSI
ncbi:hypothetical protein HRbin06_00040 [archaeon HR06]|nr:hypothetical protein HRbin06_00040 [archaeon HR06]